jgi:uncharacterized repeat protein (TIGR03803 family)
MNQKFLLFTLIALTGVIFCDPATAATFKTLHQFSAVDTNDFINADGCYPASSLTASGNILYGTTSQAGTGGNGTVFAINTDGTGFKTLYTFSSTTNASSTNSDGAGPAGQLLLSGNTLYGTATGGGSNGFGTIFGINTDGTGFTNLYTFSGGSNGGLPGSGLIASGTTLYGTTYGSAGNYGTIFSINTDGTGFTNLYTFTGGSDGNRPNGLILSGSTFYGTTSSGGSNNTGTVFAINKDGTGFTNLYSFSGATFSSQFHSYTNSEGANPRGALTLVGNTLYGATGSGSRYGGGTLFGINTDGTGFRILFVYALSSGGLISSGGTLYGTSSSGFTTGDPNSGSVFAIATNAQAVSITPPGVPAGGGKTGTLSGVTNLYTFSPDGGSGNIGGASPAAGLLLLGNTFYGTTGAGGSGDSGTVYSLSISPSATKTISVNAAPSVGGTVSGGGTFASGGMDTVTATTNTYYTFDGWSVNGTNVSTNASFSFTLTGDISLVANFNQTQYTIGVSALPEAGGMVSGGGTFGGGGTNRVTATANSGYLFKSWTTNGTSVSTQPNYSFTLKADETLVANFTQITNTISVIASPVAGGSVTGAGKFIQGSTNTVMATPKTGYSFNDWTLKGTNVSSSSSYSFPLTGNEVLVANFTQIKYTIAVSSSSSTDGTVSGGGVFVPGGSHTVKATAKSKFKFVNWTLNGAPVSTLPSYTFVLTANETLVANFEPTASP